LSIEAVIAANRFGLGARPGELSRIEGKPQGWLLDQLQGPSRPPEDIRSLPDTASVLLEVQEVREMQRRAKQSDIDEPSPDVVQKFGSIVRKHYLAQTSARFRAAADTRTGVQDGMQPLCECWLVRRRFSRRRHRAIPIARPLFAASFTTSSTR